MQSAESSPRRPTRERARASTRVAVLRIPAPECRDTRRRVAAHIHPRLPNTRDADTATATPRAKSFEKKATRRGRRTTIYCTGQSSRFARAQAGYSNRGTHRHSVAAPGVWDGRCVAVCCGGGLCHVSRSAAAAAVRGSRSSWNMPCRNQAFQLGLSRKPLRQAIHLVRVRVRVSVRT